MIMEPILRGSVKYLDDGRMVWEGRWGMTSAAFEEENQAQDLNNFRYVHNAHANFAPGDVIAFRGHFEVSSVNKGSKSQFTDKELQMEVVADSQTDSELRVISGKGSNRFGHFTLAGTFNLANKQLEIRRQYVPKPAATGASAPKKRAISDNNSISVMSSPPAQVQSVASGDSTPPSSPSSPADVAVAASVVAARKSSKETLMSSPKADLPFLSEVKAILKELRNQDTNKWFTQPVDAEALGLRDYHSVVKTPMDLGTIQAKVDQKNYLSLEQCFSDMRLTFENALMYNPRGSAVYRAAADLNAVLEDRLKRLATQMLSRSNGRGATKTPVALPVFEASSMGKRNRITKKFFEPGEDNANHSFVAFSGHDGSKSVKKKSSSSTHRSGRNNGGTQGSSSSATIKRIKLSIKNPNATQAKDGSKRTSAILSLMSEIPIISSVDATFAIPQVNEDDDEGAESFDELDLQKPGEELFMTPPPSDDEGDADERDDEDDIPLSAIPLALSSTPEFSRMANFGSMSPTNMLDEDF